MRTQEQTTVTVDVGPLTAEDVVAVTRQGVPIALSPTAVSAIEQSRRAVEELAAAIKTMVAEEGVAVILIEQHAELALSLTRDAAIMERGAIVHRATSAELLRDARPAQ